MAATREAETYPPIFFGAATPPSPAVGLAADARAQALTLAIVLAAHEDAAHTQSWRSVSPGAAHYLLFLEQSGYTRCNVERRAAELDPLRRTSLHAEPPGASDPARGRRP